MKFKIGFSADPYKNEAPVQTCPTDASISPSAPRQSVVRVYFPARNMTLPYYNDRFDLHRGDLVFVDGKLEGLRGRVIDVAYNFKIKLSDYKRVIAVADTHVAGQLHLATSHFVSFHPSVMPYQKVLGWFMPPAKEEDVYISGEDDTSFPLDNLSGMGATNAIGERGHDYYMSNKVVYLCLDGARGHAIVEGSKPYELEFEYRNGEISHLTCSCFCSNPCKHQVAAMLQLRETLNLIERHYATQYQHSNYFSAISKGAFMSLVVDGKETGSFTL